MSKTKIIACKCVHEFQDKTYGEKKRVHNRTGGDKTRGWRCTVCKHEKSS